LKLDQWDHHGQLFGDDATSEQLYGIEFAAEQPSGAQGGFVDFSPGFEVTLEVIKIDRPDGVTESGLVEAALGQAAEKWHLTALEGRSNAATGASFLAFVALAGSFTVPGTFSTTDTLAAFFGSRAGFQIVQSHGRNFRSLR
jgi:hypothetical protein